MDLVLRRSLPNHPATFPYPTSTSQLSPSEQAFLYLSVNSIAVKVVMVKENLTPNCQCTIMVKWAVEISEVMIKFAKKTDING